MTGTSASFAYALIRSGATIGVRSTEALLLLSSPPARSQTSPTIAAPTRAPATPTRIVLDRATAGFYGRVGDSRRSRAAITAQSFHDQVPRASNPASPSHATWSAARSGRS